MHSRLNNLKALFKAIILEMYFSVDRNYKTYN